MDEDHKTLNSTINNQDNVETNMQSRCMWTTYLTIITGILIIFFIIVSFYAVILCNFIFFVSSFFSFFMCPLLNCFYGSWFDYFASMIRILITSSFIEFYILFIKISVCNLAEVIELFYQVFFGLVELSLNGDCLNIKSIIDDNFKSRFYLNVATIIALTIVLVFGILSIFFPYFFLIPGGLVYLSIVSQIFHKMWFVCIKWAKIIFFNNFEGEIPKISQESDPEPKDNEETKDKTEEDSDEYHEVMKLLREFDEKFVKCFKISDYNFIIDHANEISKNQNDFTRNRIILIVISIINLLVIIYDFIKYSQVRNLAFDSTYFLISIILRTLFVPLTSYYNFIFAFLYKFKKLLHKFIFRGVIIFGIILMVLSIIVYASIVSNYNRANRIHDLPPPNETFIHILDGNQYSESKFCKPVYKSYTLLELIGLSLGPYDIYENETVFSNQYEYFFGNKNHFISPQNITIGSTKIPFIIYNNTETNTIIFAFRGFSSPPEIAIYLQLLLDQYFSPFLYDICPFFDTLAEDFLDLKNSWIYKLGFNFFDPQLLIHQFLVPIQKIYDNEYSSSQNVVFTGINVGGIFAKILGMNNRKPSFSFYGYSVFSDIIHSFLITLKKIL